MGTLTLRVSQAFAWASSAYNQKKKKKKLSSCDTTTYKKIMNRKYNRRKYVATNVKPKVQQP